MNTPAVTMVAAWISADTGVGPSIASGSQVCRPSCADLPHRADEQQQAGAGQRVDVMPEQEVEAKRCQFRRVGENYYREFDRTGQQEDRRDAQYETEIADTVDDKALIEALLADGFSYQKLISR